MRSRYHVFALVGKSGSGKTTLQYAMRHTFSIPQGLTTREKREGDVIGQYVYAKTNEEFFDYVMSGKTVCSHTAYDCLYAYLKEGFLTNHSIVVVDLVDLRQLQEYFGFENVTGIYMEADADIRIERTKNRSSSNAQTRQKTDEVKFHNAYHLCDYKITNDGSIKDAIDEFKSIVAEVLKDKGYI